MTAGTIAARQPLLVELFTEELPPRALQRLGQAFAEGITERLAQRGLVAADVATTGFASPRRLGVLIRDVLAQAADQPFREKLMPVRVGLTDDGKATPALQKKLSAKGLDNLDPATLARESDGRQDYLVYEGVAPGASLADGLQQALDETLGRLPIPKVMGYQLADGQTTVRFVRPAHGLIALHGADIVPVQVLGLTAGRTTHGHRFQAQQSPITVAQATDYAETLRTAGSVIASYELRRADIEQQLRTHAAQLGASLGDETDVGTLLDEVTALVERPAVYVGEFEPAFLRVPAECLILTMRLNQKYFPLFNTDGSLSHRFLIVSNMTLSDPANIIQGNQRVVRPRLADARFFFDTDLAAPLASRIDTLESIVYHNRLGSQRARSERVAGLAGWIAASLGGNATAAERAARLAKADLTTQMVGEFPELQGIMGAYYAAHDQEAADVVEAIRRQYQIRLDAPVDAAALTTAALFLAERAETLAGIWAIGLAPTGDKDPYALRRAALGVISAFEQLTAGGLLQVADAAPALTLDALLSRALQQLPEGIVAGRDAALLDELRSFILERYRNQLANRYDRSAIDAVLAVLPPLHQVPARVEAVAQFQAQPAAASLAAANKRTGNLLRKAAEQNEPVADTIDEALLREPAEQALANAIAQAGPPAAAALANGDFSGNMAVLAGVRDSVDQFFTDVMVLADDPAVRRNRLALLARLHGLMNQVADISRLAT